MGANKKTKKPKKIKKEKEQKIDLPPALAYLSELIESGSLKELYKYLLYIRKVFDMTECFTLFDDFHEKDGKEKYNLLVFLEIWVGGFFSEDFWDFAKRKVNETYSSLLETLEMINESSSHCNTLNTIKLMILRQAFNCKNPPDPVLDLTKEMSHNNDAVDPIQIENTKLFSHSPDDIAYYLTFVEEQLFKAIRVTEFYNMAWQGETKYEKAINIVRITNRFNKVSLWVATQIITQSSHSLRIKVIKIFIRIAHRFEKLRNYNGVMEVLAGLSMWSIARLPEWRDLSAKYSNKLDGLKEVMSSEFNFRRYREILKHSIKLTHRGISTLPYLGLYLTDLTMAEGADELVDGQINLDKVSVVTNVLDEVKVFQTVEKDLPKGKSVQDPEDGKKTAPSKKGSSMSVIYHNPHQNGAIPQKTDPSMVALQNYLLSFEYLNEELLNKLSENIKEFNPKYLEPDVQGSSFSGSTVSSDNVSFSSKESFSLSEKESEDSLSVSADEF